MLHILDKQNTIINKFLAELRDIDVQKDSMRFRRNLERIGECAAYELSKSLNYVPKKCRLHLLRRRCNVLVMR